MKIRHKEITIEAGNPFANCKLDRKKYADILTEIINAHSEGFVLAINNKWGTGKSTFIQMWEQHLKDNNFQTVYFNAWENDFENNPLIALMGELKTLTKSATEPEFKSILKKAAIISKNIVPIVAQAVVDRYIESKDIKDLIVNATEGLTDVFENDVNEYAEKKKSIADFRKELSHFIASTSNEKPLIFIIDELDRCRPNYAVSILEQIKHFFSVPNIVFVLSIDKIQLGNAVRGVYGSDKIDAEEYLRRFIDIEYSIPEPNKDIYQKYLYDYFDFDSFLEVEDRKQIGELKYDKKYFLEISDVLFSNSSITLRQLEKIFSHSRLSLRAFEKNMYLIPEVYLFLIFLKVLNEELYQDIKLKRFSIIDFQKKYLETVIHKLDEKTENLLIWLEAHLILYYSNYINDPYQKNKIYAYDPSSRENKLLINSIINNNKNDEFLNILENTNRGRTSSSLDFGHFLKKIDLTEPLIN